MKFCAFGPDIPDDLLWKRDDGDTVFVCGSGVSTPKALLPGFADLASQVMCRLRVPENHRARDILKASQESISMDRLFSDLEKDYYIDEIEKSISDILSPPESVDTSYHKIISDLATTPDKKIRLVTTNFDNLFSEVTDCKEWVWPNLPNSEQAKSLDALVYLHGKCSADEDSKDNPYVDPYYRKFVISTSSFGRAYLSDRQASVFVQSILERFTVVFIGYSANDPPVQYLLEALAQRGNRRVSAYAFQRETGDPTYEKWKQRGVIPICYEHHDHLWTTLAAWRSRSLDLESWMNSVIDMAQESPVNLEKWHRSQVRHLASHPTGTKMIAASRSMISPQWLFAFDPQFRYATPKRNATVKDDVLLLDPFESLGFSEDKMPELTSHYDDGSVREVPNNAWSAFHISPTDRLEMEDKKYYSNFNQANIHDQKTLPERLENLAIWIGKISQYPVTLRWAIHQDELHPFVKKQVLSQLTSSKNQESQSALQAWEALFESWERHKYNGAGRMKDLQRQIQNSGWSESRLSLYQRLLEPRLFVRKDSCTSEVFRSEYAKMDMSLDIEYYTDSLELPISEKWIPKVLSADRTNLIRAISLETQIQRYQSYSIPPLKESFKHSYNKEKFSNQGLDSLLFCYMNRLEKAHIIDPNFAIKEFRGWPADDNNIFARLRIWIAGKKDILPPNQAGLLLARLPQDVFWHAAHRIDLIDAIESRWKSFSIRTKEKIGKRILRGVSFESTEFEKDYRIPSEFYLLKFFEELEERDCVFESDISNQISKLKGRILESNPNVVMDSKSRISILGYKIESQSEFESRGTYTHRDNGYGYVVRPSPKNRLSKDLERFMNFCENDHAAAFKDIRMMANAGDFPTWMWERWLHGDWDSEKCAMYLDQTTALVRNAPIEQVTKFSHHIFLWFQVVSSRYSSENHNLRNSLFKKLIQLLKFRIHNGTERIYSSSFREFDWVTYSSKSHAGLLVRGLLSYPEFLNSGDDAEIPKYWYDSATSVLQLPGDNGRFALIEFVRQTKALHQRNPKWNQENIIDRIDGSDPLDIQAYFAGVSSIPNLLENRNIFISVKRGILNAMLSGISMSDRTCYEIVAMIFSIWCDECESSDEDERIFSDAAFCDVLLNHSQSICEAMLDYFLRSMRHSEGTELSMAVNYIEYFFLNVWPLNRSIVSQSTTQYLIQLALSNQRLFVTLIPLIYPRLDGGMIDCCELGDLNWIDPKIVEEHPKDLLRLLFYALPRDSRKWYIGIDKTFDAIGSSSPGLTNDYHFTYLKRRSTL